MDKTPSGNKPSDQKQDEVIRDGGNASPLVTPSAETLPIGDSSAVPHGAGVGDSSPPPPLVESPKGDSKGGRTMKPLSERGKQPAITGGSSATSAGSPQTPIETLEGGKAEVEGPKKKRKKAAFDGPQYPKPCVVCSKSFSSWKALFGHMRSHKNRQWRGVYPPPISSSEQQVRAKQTEELASSLLHIGERILDKTKGNETPSEGGTVAEGSASSSAAEALRKKIHLELDLNKEAPEDSDEEGGSNTDGA